MKHVQDNTQEHISIVIRVMSSHVTSLLENSIVTCEMMRDGRNGILVLCKQIGLAPLRRSRGHSVEPTVITGVLVNVPQPLEALSLSLLLPGPSWHTLSPSSG
jgi:hypothetical protein